MAVIILEIHGNPVAQGRPKFFRRGNFVGAYNPQGKEDDKLKLLFKQQWGNRPLLSGPVKMRVYFHMQRPQYHFRSGKNRNLLKDSAPAIHTFKPDIDNLLKKVYDCLNQVVWVDDALVYSCSVTKGYSSRPRTEIFIIEGVEEDFEKGI